MELWMLSIFSLALCKQEEIDIIYPPLDDFSDIEIEHPIIKEDTWNIWDEITFTSHGLFTSSEKIVTEKNPTNLSKIQEALTYCDFLTTGEQRDGHLIYVPAVCVLDHHCKQAAPFTLTAWGNATCTNWANSVADDREYTCCPINGTKEWRSSYEGKVLGGDRRYREFREIPSNLELAPNTPYVYVSGRNFEYMEREEQEKLQNFFDKDYYKPYEKEMVCGFAKGRYLGVKKPNPSGAERKVHLWYPYFCVKPEQCGKAASKGFIVPSTNPLWHQFCQLKFEPEDNEDYLRFGQGDRYLFPLKNQNTHCCHVNDMEDLNKGSSFAAAPQMPTYLKFAPGVRSVFKCEEYAKHACDGVSPCTEGFYYPPEPGENPHMATLGFIAPNLMDFYCGGALVSLRYILSAASCKSPRYYPGYQVNIAILGEHALSSHEPGKEKIYIITEILQAFGYPAAFRKRAWQDHGVRPQSDQIDLALYRTNVEVQLSRYVRPACLYYGHHVWPKHPQFIGWGSRDPSSPRSEYLETLTKLESQQYCVSDKFFQDENENPFYGRWGANNNWMACFKNPPGPSTALPEGHSNPCFMDHGGPLQEKLISPFCTTLLLGTLSSQSFCQRLIPSVFINNTHFLSALEDELWGNTSFVDMHAEQFEMPGCGPSEGPRPNRKDFFFFNKCYGGEDCN